jgi:7,8-dihydropterin-6-yl-methyl-4-(beta-D-ribofuranosyl)aminobenzene 5'-phosphate synthase
MVKLTVLAENSVAVSLGQVAEHGWSVLLEDGDRRVLFDTGQGACLETNPRLLGKDLSRLDAIVLSHGHSDHTRGLLAALRASGGADLYCHPAALQKKKVRRTLAGREITLEIGLPYSQPELEAKGARFHFLTRPTALTDHLTISGEIPLVTDFESLEPGFFADLGQGEVPDPFADDLALFVRTEKGLSVILGCAHRGVINTLRAAAAWAGAEQFFALIGGNHLHSRGAEQVDKTLAALEQFHLRLIAPAHCTGPRVTARIFERFGERALPCPVGSQFEL